MRTPEEQEKLLDKLESLLSQFDEANDRFDRNEWSNKFKERFSPYEDKLKSLNGDDFDLMKESYDEYHKDYSNMSDDDYANSLEDNIKSVIARIWPEAPEEKVEEVAEEVAEEPVVEEVAEEPVVEETDIIIDEDEDEDEDNFIKELEEYKANMPQRK